MTHLGMISYQGTAGGCDGRARVTLEYKFGGQSDWGRANYIRAQWQEAGLTALSSSPTTNTDLLCQTHVYEYYTCTALALHIIKMSPGWARQKYWKKNVRLIHCHPDIYKTASLIQLVLTSKPLIRYILNIQHTRYMYKYYFIDCIIFSESLEKIQAMPTILNLFLWYWVSPW